MEELINEKQIYCNIPCWNVHCPEQFTLLQAKTQIRDEQTETIIATIEGNIQSGHDVQDEFEGPYHGNIPMNANS